MFAPPGVNDGEHRVSLRLLECVGPVGPNQAALLQIGRALLPLCLTVCQTLAGVVEDHVHDLLAGKLRYVEAREVYGRGVETV